MQKKVILVILIAVFVYLSSDVISDYLSIDNKTQSLNSTVSGAVDQAVTAMLLGEEFFTSGDSYSSATEGTISVWNGSSFTSGNLFVIAYYMEQNDGSVPSQSAYNNLVSSWGGTSSGLARGIFSVIYGNPSTRFPTAEFEDFYNNIGSSITTETLVKNGEVFTSFEYPLLAQTGLKLDAVNSGSADTLVNLQSVENSSQDGGTYFTTANSLGVTYLDKGLLENVIRCFIDNRVRCNRVASLGDSDLSLASFADATQVYPIGSGVAEEVKNLSNHDIVTDGQVIYFLDTVDVEITYSLIDYWDNDNWKIVNYLHGYETDGSDPKTLPSRLKASSNNMNSLGVKPSSNYIVVAEVKVSIDVSIPYNSWVLQWNRYHSYSGGDEFYGVLSIDDLGNIASSDDGLTYYYTSFCAVVN